MLHLQRQLDHRDAKSTTSEEMSDLLYKTATRFHDKTGSWPYIQMDNNAIQAEIDISCLHTNHYQDGPYTAIPADHLIRVPTYSPDCNRAVEHQFANGKGRLCCGLYHAKAVINSGQELQKALLDAFVKRMTSGSVAADVATLPLLWKILSTNEGVRVCEDGGETYVGTGGGWPASPYR